MPCKPDDEGRGCALAKVDAICLGESLGFFGTASVLQSDRAGPKAKRFPPRISSPVALIRILTSAIRIGPPRRPGPYSARKAIASYPLALATCIGCQLVQGPRCRRSPKCLRVLCHTGRDSVGAQARVSLFQKTVAVPLQYPCSGNASPRKVPEVSRQCN